MGGRIGWLSVALMSLVLACGGSESGDSDGGVGGGLELDPDFGEGGVLRARSDWSTDVVYDAARAADGRILVAGSTSSLGHRREGLVARYTAAGVIDASWGRAGFAFLSFHDQVTISDIEALPDGGAVMVGTTFYGIRGYGFVARFDSAGAVDATFGTRGMTAWEGDFNSHIALARAGDGTLYTLTSDLSKAQLRRFDADGALDTSFGNEDHFVAVTGEEARELMVLDDGRILALVDDSTNGYVHRLTSTGVLDTAFGTGGTYELDEVNVFDMALEPGGDDLLIAGSAPWGQLLKLDENGASVAAFGTDGVVLVSAEEELMRMAWLPGGNIVLLDAIETDYPRGLMRKLIGLGPDGAPIAFDTTASAALSGAWTSSLLADDNAIYLAGAHRPDGGGVNPAGVELETVVLALDHDGTARASFGDAGVAQTGSGAAPEVLWDMTRDPQGRLVAMGAAVTNGIFLRFDGGSFDTGFGDDGFAPTRPIAILLNSVIIDDAGRIAGPTFGYNLVRYLADGAPDASFGSNGMLNFKSGNGLVADIIIDGQGRIVAVGEAPNEGPVLVRVNPDGSLDDGFGAGGVVVAPVGNMGAGIAVLEQPDGKLVITGLQLSPRGSFIARLDADGSVDASFGAGGETFIDQRLRLLRLEPRVGGGFLASGYRGDCPETTDCSIAVVAIDASGALDAGFGSGGIAEVGASFFTAWTGLAQLDDGSIYLAGAVDDGTREQLAVWRLLSDGALDTEFANDGVYVFPGRGRATNLVADGDGLIVAGWHFDPQSGTDAVLLRFEP